MKFILVGIQMSCQNMLSLVKLDAVCELQTWRFSVCKWACKKQQGFLTRPEFVLSMLWISLAVERVEDFFIDTKLAGSDALEVWLVIMARRHTDFSGLSAVFLEAKHYTGIFFETSFYSQKALWISDLVLILELQLHVLLVVLMRCVSVQKGNLTSSGFKLKIQEVLYVRQSH